MVQSIDGIVGAFGRFGDRMRGTYRAHYRFDSSMSDPYGAAPRLERPECLAEDPNPPYPWEQIFVAAAACTGSDYPMFAAHFGIPLERVELVLEGVFDPRGEFDEVSGYRAPPDARHCYLALHVRTTIVSSAPRAELEKLHERAIEYNMVLNGLRGIPQTSELTIVPSRAEARAAVA
jgi:uncharacterized OsmC-like protein